MRGADRQQSRIFSYISAEKRVPKDHPLRAIRAMVDVALRNMGPQFDAMYAKVGRPSIPPEKLLRALLLQVLYTVRSERMLMEQLDYNLLFRWFVGMNIDDPVWDVTVFTKNRERLLVAEIAKTLFAEVLEQARSRDLLSTEHFTVDGTLIEAWASHKSFKPKEGADQQPPDDPGNPTVDFHGEQRSNATHQFDHRPRSAVGAQRSGQGSQAELRWACADGEPQRHSGQRLRDPSRRPCRTASRAGDGRGDPRRAPGHLGRRQRVRPQGVCSRVARPPGDSAYRVQAD